MSDLRTHSETSTAPATEARLGAWEPRSAYRFTKEMSASGGLTTEDSVAAADPSLADQRRRIFNLETPSGSAVYALVVSGPSADESVATFFSVGSDTTPRTPIRSLSELIGDAAAHLTNEPLEDGFTHPADATMHAILRNYASGFLDMLGEYAGADDHDDLLADMIRLAGRQSIPKRAAKDLLAFGLAHTNASVRDATVSAVEDCLDDELASCLRRHNDGVAWIRTYIAQVLGSYESNRRS